MLQEQAVVVADLKDRNQELGGVPVGVVVEAEAELETLVPPEDQAVPDKLLVQIHLTVFQ